MKLSKYFSLEEFTRSDTAKKLGIDNTPSPEHIANMAEFAADILDTLRENWGSPIIISSGYRGFYLNKAVKGSSTSAHCYGLAADLIPANGDIKGFKKFVPKCLAWSNKKFDQFIDETNTKGSEWVHIGYKDRKGRQRNQKLMTKDGKNYKPWQEPVPEDWLKK